MLFDAHTHTLCSNDSQAPLADMVAAAHAAGLGGLCTTDHCDFLDLEGKPSLSFDWANILHQYQQVRQTLPKGFHLRLGLELGWGQLDPAAAQVVVAGAPLDYVLGSVHNRSPAAGGKDFYFVCYNTIDRCHADLQNYLQSLALLAPQPFYDCLAHINYPTRYMSAAGHTISLADYEEQLRAILTSAAQTGHGLEVNTNRGRDLNSWAYLVGLFLSCGGEIVTIGSDAHAPQHVGLGISQAHAILQSCGLRYYAVYQGRIPQFYRL